MVIVFFCFVFFSLLLHRITTLRSPEGHGERAKKWPKGSSKMVGEEGKEKKTHLGCDFAKSLTKATDFAFFSLFSFLFQWSMHSLT